MVVETSSVATAVASTFDAYDGAVRKELLALRQLILDTANATPDVGPIEETLKWAQPSYLTSVSGSGSTIRIAPTAKKSSHDYAMFFICHTTLVDDFKSLFGDLFSYDGNRAVLFRVGDTIPKNELRECIAMALTYHRSRV